MSAETDLVELLAEMRGFPRPPHDRAHRAVAGAAAHAVRLRGQVPSLMSIVIVFGTAVDITLAELAIETFPPADAATPALLT